jgi:eukaryotic-like serine/threonine-protein kinase
VSITAVSIGGATMSLFGKSKVEKTDIEKRFKLIGRVGQGSMSKVWRAEDKMSGHYVAVKVLDKEKTKRFEDRFKGLNKPTETQIAFKLQHPYIVKTLEVGWTLEEEMFLVMDYVEGSGLSLLVDLQSDDLRRYRTRFLIQIGEALDYFHKQGFIHRDICPRNIMVTDDHKIRLIDFGLTVPNTPDFCKPGNRTGTANYMAPELIKRRPTDHRIDVFSYSVTCYEMYANRHPWDAALTLDAVMQHINQPPVDLLELVPKMDRQIADTIMKGLALDPDNRWQKVEEMTNEFRAAEVRLVQKTKELLAKRKRRAGGDAESKSGRTPGESRPDQKPAVKKLPTPTVAKTAKSPKAPVTVDDDFDPFGDDAPDDSGADILMTGGEDPQAEAAAPKTVAKKKRPRLSATPAPPPAVPEDSSDAPDKSDEDILALPED